MDTYHWKFYAAFGSLCLANFVCALDATSISVALQTIASDLHGTTIQAFWAGTSFLLSSTVFQPIFVSFSQIFGRKPLLLLALTLFAVGSLLCGVAQSFTHLLAGRSVQGIGSGGISTLTYVVVTDLVGLRERGKWFGFISMTWALGSVLGPLAGGLLSQKATWRLIFLLNLPICGAAFALILMFLTLNTVPGSFCSKLAKMDWFGSFLFASSLTSFLIPTTWGGVMYPWNHWRTLVPISLGVGGLLGFVFWSMFAVGEPILRRTMFTSKTALSSYFGTAIVGMIIGSSLYFSPFYFQVAKGYSPIMTGVAILPWTFSIGPLAIIFGVWIAKRGRYRWAILSGWLTTLVGVGHLPLFQLDTPAIVWVSLSLLSGSGLGVLYPATSFAIQASASDIDLPFAAGLISFFRSFGYMLGVAIGGVALQNALKQKLSGFAEIAPFADKYSKEAAGLVEAIRAMPVSELRTHLINSYVSALGVMWLVMTALTCSAFVIGFFFTENITLDRVLQTEHGFIQSGVSIRLRN